MTKVRKKASQKLGHGKRYSDEVKARVGAFVNQINSEKGHGGISAAARKFGGSPLSIRSDDPLAFSRCSGWLLLRDVVAGRS